MSGRLIITPHNPEQELGCPVQAMAPLKTGFNLSPTSTLSILRQPDQQVVQDDAFWSFTPPWLKQLDQAPYLIRSDKLASSPMFRDSFASRRCLLLVTGYYVWVHLSRGKHPFAVRRQHNRPFALAGLWTRYPTGNGRFYDSFGLISVAADPWLARLTARIPLKLLPEQALEWLAPDTPTSRLQSLLHTQDHELEYYPVSQQVNDPASISNQTTAPIASRHQRPPE